MNYDGCSERIVLPVCRQCEGISGYGRVSAVPEQFPFRCKNDAGDYGRITNDITAAPISLLGVTLFVGVP